MASTPLPGPRPELGGDPCHLRSPTVPSMTIIVILITIIVIMIIIITITIITITIITIIVVIVIVIIQNPRARAPPWNPEPLNPKTRELQIPNPQTVTGLVQQLWLPPCAPKRSHWMPPNCFNRKAHGL